MIEFVLSHFLAILGGLGIGGAILVLVLVWLGYPLALLFANALGVIKEIVAFFRTPLGQQVAIAIACFASFIAGGVYGVRLELRRSEARIAEINRDWQQRVDDAERAFERARIERDREVDERIRKFVEQKNAEIAALQKKVDQYAGKDHPDCVLTPADLGRLRRR